MLTNKEILNSKSVLITLASIVIIMVFLSSCKYTNQQNEMLDMLENSGVEVSDELRNEASYNWADIIFPLSIVLSFGLITFFIIRKARRRISDVGYSFGEMKNKMNTIVENEKIGDKMSQEEKEGIDAMQKLFNNKSE